MPYRVLLVIALLSLAACSGDRTESAPGAVARAGGAEAVPSWRDEHDALGRATYERACASCHETGEGEAPVTGQREDWSGRSDMWQAVLFEHAKSGYLEMPGKGGQDELSDEAVEAASEYMLERTFPELPKD